jgi:hypothetical protein
MLQNDKLLGNGGTSILKGLLLCDRECQIVMNCLMKQ